LLYLTERVNSLQRDLTISKGKRLAPPGDTSHCCQVRRTMSDRSHWVGIKALFGPPPPGSGRVKALFWPTLSGSGQVKALFWPPFSGSGRVEALFWPTLSGSGQVEALFWPPFSGSGRVKALFWPTLSGSGQFEALFWPTLSGSGRVGLAQKNVSQFCGRRSSFDSSDLWNKLLKNLRDDAVFYRQMIRIISQVHFPVIRHQRDEFI